MKGNEGEAPIEKVSPLPRASSPTLGSEARGGPSLGKGSPHCALGGAQEGPGSAASSGARSSEAPERYPPAGKFPGGLAGARQIPGQWNCRGPSPEIQPLAVRTVKDPVWFTRDLRRFT